MKKMIFTLLFCLIASTSFAASVNLQWDANTESDLTGYKVYFGNYSGNTTNFVAVGTSPLITTTTYTVTGLDSLKKWFFRVTALNPYMQSPYSNNVSVAFIKSPTRARFTAVDVR